METKTLTVPEQRALLTLQAARVSNEMLLARASFFSRWIDPRRNIDIECGHPEVLSTENYMDLYTRGDVASRVVSVYPEETWSQEPGLFENEEEALTPFEQAWADLNLEFSLIAHLEQADIVSGIGRFGVLLLGVDDGGDMGKPIDGLDITGKTQGPDRKLLYLRSFDESVLTINALETDVRNPRFGLPVSYAVRFTDNLIGKSAVEQEVHWHRIIHFADGRRNSLVYGTPRLEKVANRIFDLHKIAGGSGEMFWKGGFPGLSVQSHPTALNEEIDFDKDATRTEMEAYMNGLQRYIATSGMDVKSLGVQVADPRPHVEVQMRSIASCLGVPWRIFVGSESAHLASSQDSTTWNRRLAKRRRNYVNPYLLRPFVNRLIGLGIVPKPEKYAVWWPDLETPGDEAKAAKAEKQSNAISKYVTTGSDVLIPPFYFLTLVLGMSDEEARSIIKKAGLESGSLPEPPMPIAGAAGTRGRVQVPAGVARNGH